MKRNWIWPLLIGLALGVTLGVVLGERSSRSAVPEGSPLLREFSFAALTAKAGHTNWQVLEDRTYKPFPALSRSKRIARRVIARADMSDVELDRFTTQFQQAATATLDACGALNKAQFDLVQDATRVVDGSPIRSRLDLPRRYYAIGDIHGVADLGYIAESGRVTVIVSLIEGR